MDVALLSILILIIMIAFIRLWPSSTPVPYRGSRSSDKVGNRRNTQTAVSRRSSAHRSVSIVCDFSACEAAKALRHNRYLVSEAPLFPLPDCGSSNCSCKYAHHEDRRGERGDRRASMALSSELFERTGGKNRRGESGRHCW